MNISSTWRNSTVLDPIFGFRNDAPPPVFWRLPDLRNSNLNGNWNAMNAVYLLLAFEADRFSLCSLSMSFRGGCSSELTVSASSSTLSTNCAQHDMSYNQLLPQFPQDAKPQNATLSNWVHFAYRWAEAVALDSGNSTTNAAAPAMLAEFAPLGPIFNPTRPLLVEALAVLAGNTLLDSMVGAPFDGAWPYQNASIPTPVLQSFEARVTRSIYVSGGNTPWKNVFMLVLATTFILSSVCFGYLLFISCISHCLSRFGRRDSTRNGLRQDCTDLNELFQIALNSPQPGQGSPVCNAREKGELQKLKWRFRNNTPATTATSPDRLDGLHVVFDGGEELRNISPRSGYFTTMSPSHFGREPRGFRKLETEDGEGA